MSAELPTKTLLGCSSPLNNIASVLSPMRNSAEVVSPLSSGMKKVRRLLDSLSPLKTVSDGITQAKRMKNIYPSLTKISNALSPVEDIHNALLQVKSLAEKIIPENQQKTSEPKYSFENNNLKPQPGMSDIKNKVYDASLTVIKNLIMAKKDNCDWREATISALGSTIKTELSNQFVSSPKSPNIPQVKVPTNSECGLCSKDLSNESSITLPCGHSFHSKCLYCCFIFFEAENLGALNCPIEECRKVVPKKIVELLKKTDNEKQ